MHIKGISRPLDDGDSVEVHSFHSVKWARSMVNRANRHFWNKQAPLLADDDCDTESIANEVVKALEEARAKAKTEIDWMAVLAMVKAKMGCGHYATAKYEAPKPKPVTKSLTLSTPCVVAMKPRELVYTGTSSASSAEYRGVHPYAHEFLKRSGNHRRRR